jgi:hypothetical protein
METRARAMSHRLTAYILVCTIPYLLGCPIKNASIQRDDFTASTAKDALIVMLKQTDDDELRGFLEPLEGKAPQVESDGEIIKFGPWTCNMSMRTFDLFLVSPDQRDFVEWSGTFIQNDTGHWIAKVVEKRQT